MSPRPKKKADKREEEEDKETSFYSFKNSEEEEEEGSLIPLSSFKKPEQQKYLLFSSHISDKTDMPPLSSFKAKKPGEQKYFSFSSQRSEKEKKNIQPLSSYKLKNLSKELKELEEEEEEEEEEEKWFSFSSQISREKKNKIPFLSSFMNGRPRQVGSTRKPAPEPKKPQKDEIEEIEEIREIYAGSYERLHLFQDALVSKIADLQQSEEQFYIMNSDYCSFENNLNSLKMVQQSLDAKVSSIQSEIFDKIDQKDDLIDGENSSEEEEEDNFDDEIESDDDLDSYSNEELMEEAQNIIVQLKRIQNLPKYNFESNEIQEIKEINKRLSELINNHKE